MVHHPEVTSGLAIFRKGQRIPSSSCPSCWLLVLSWCCCSWPSAGVDDSLPMVLYGRSFLKTGSRCITINISMIRGDLENYILLFVMCVVIYVCWIGVCWPKEQNGCRSKIRMRQRGDEEKNRILFEGAYVIVRRQPIARGRAAWCDRYERLQLSHIAFSRLHVAVVPPSALGDDTHDLVILVCGPTNIF